MRVFLLLILTTLLAFSSLKAEEKLTSESFEITQLENVVSGDYLEHTISYLPARWTITNTSQFTVTFRATLEKISMGSTHYMMYCIGDACSFWYGTGVNTTWTSGLMTYEPGASSKPDLDSYLGMFSGNDEEDAMLWIDTFRVTYKNVDNADDYVTFLCVWNFKDMSIEIIEDISNKIFPNPTQEKLNLILGENNINEIEFFDINGNKLLSQDVTHLSEVNVDISAFSAGVYIGYFVKSGNRVKIFRFVKQP